MDGSKITASHEIDANNLPELLVMFLDLIELLKYESHELKIVEQHEKNYDYPF